MVSHTWRQATSKCIQPATKECTRQGLKSLFCPCAVRNTTVPTRALAPISDRSSRARATIAKARSPLYYPLLYWPKGRWRRMAREQVQTPETTQRANKRTSERRQRQSCGPRRPLKAPGLSDWLLRQDVAFDWLGTSRAAPTEGWVGGPTVKVRPSGPVAQYVGVTAFATTRGVAGAPRDRMAGSCSEEAHGPGESPGSIATGPPAA